jgi:Pathogenicity locus
MYMAKARTACDVKKFTDIPNVGKAVAEKYQRLGFKTPSELAGKDGFVLYQKLCKKDGVRHDPCLLDTFLAVEGFMSGGVAKQWFLYTKKRKQKYPNV